MPIRDESITPEAEDIVEITWAGEGSHYCILLEDKDGDLIPVRPSRVVLLLPAPVLGGSALCCVRVQVAGLSYFLTNTRCLLPVSSGWLMGRRHPRLQRNREGQRRLEMAE